MILTIRTDKPEAEIGLFDSSGKQLEYKKWQAHRELSSTILAAIKELLDSQNVEFEALEGLVFYKGPGSFTGLRIGASVANALQTKCVNEAGESWVETGIRRLQHGESEPAMPEYGADPHITVQKK